MSAATRLFDSHLHIIDPRFPLVPNHGYLPQPFSCDDYLRRMADYRLCGGAVVSGSFHAFDQGYLLAALKTLGPGFVGVTQLPPSVSDAQIARLHAAGVRALRFNLYRGGPASLEHLACLAHRVYELAGWHVELYVDGAELAQLSATLNRLPALSIDHLGLRRAGLADLLRLAERGVRVKASGFGRVDFDVAQAIVALYQANPDCLMFGTDLPSTRAPLPFQDRHIDLVSDALGPVAAARVFSENAIAFYKPARS
ncbi:MAG: amidohydrolase family protein [Halioglobus sp.]|nr:amidohydrolase family protein [Halioglobus sp.]